MSRKQISNVARLAVTSSLLLSSLVIAVACGGNKGDGTRVNRNQQQKLKDVAHEAVMKILGESFEANNAFDPKAEPNVALSAKIEGVSAFAKTNEGAGTVALQVVMVTSTGERIVGAESIDVKKESRMKELSVSGDSTQYTIEAKCGEQSDRTCSIFVVHVKEKAAPNGRFVAILRQNPEASKKEQQAVEQALGTARPAATQRATPPPGQRAAQQAARPQPQPTAPPPVLDQRTRERLQCRTKFLREWPGDKAMLELIWRSQRAAGGDTKTFHSVSALEAYAEKTTNAACAVTVTSGSGLTPPDAANPSPAPSAPPSADPNPAPSAAPAADPNPAPSAAPVAAPSAPPSADPNPGNADPAARP